MSEKVGPTDPMVSPDRREIPPTWAEQAYFDLVIKPLRKAGFIGESMATPQMLRTWSVMNTSPSSYFSTNLILEGKRELLSGKGNITVGACGLYYPNVETTEISQMLRIELSPIDRPRPFIVPLAIFGEQGKISISEMSVTGSEVKRCYYDVTDPRAGEDFINSSEPRSVVEDRDDFRAIGVQLTPHSNIIRPFQAIRDIVDWVINGGESDLTVCGSSVFTVL